MMAKNAAKVIPVALIDWREGGREVGGRE